MKFRFGKIPLVPAIGIMISKEYVFNLDASKEYTAYFLEINFWFFGLTVEFGHV